MNRSQSKQLAKQLVEMLREPRLTACATHALPAWLWKPDGTRILWANAVGAAIFSAPDTAALASRTFDPADRTARQIARLSASLKHDAPPRLERLRGFGAGFGAALLCACSRIVVNGEAAILIAAAEPAGPALSYSERVRRLLPADPAAAAFAADATLIATNESPRAPLLASASLSDPGFAETAASALRSGRSEATTDGASVALHRIGSGSEAFLLALYEDESARPHQAEPARNDAPVPESRNPAPDPAPGSTPAPAPVNDGSDRVPAADQRRHPLRFVWQMDASGRFSLGAGEFADVIGPTVAASFGRLWPEIADELNIDPDGEILRAVASRETWSGIAIEWPVEGTDERLPVEMSGLPIFDRERNFRGYRGFGVCRDVEKIGTLADRRFLRDARPAALPNPSRQPDSENVVSLRAREPFTPRPEQTLTPVERSAFREIGSRLSERLRGADAVATGKSASGRPDETVSALPIAEKAPAALAAALSPAHDPLHAERPVLDRIPVGVLVYRHTQLIYANPAFLDWSGHRSLAEFSGAGGVDTLFIDMHESSEGDRGQSLRIAHPGKQDRPVGARLFSIPFDDTTAMALVLSPAASHASAPAVAAPAADADLRAILSLVSDGMLVVSRAGRIVESNEGAEILFGLTRDALAERTFTDLFVADSARTARDCLDWLARSGAPRTLSESREVGGRRANGHAVPLTMTIGRIGGADGSFAVLLRDISAWRKSQDSLLAAKRQAEKESAAKSEFLARISHEIRTPLNAIIGFSDVMMNERFGPVGNDRYKAYLHDIHTSGEHLISLVNDLLDLSKIEAGKLELSPVSADLNELTRQSVAIMQPQAAQERIIVRLALGESLPRIVADERSVRQILLNLISNAVKFTDAGGQVIVSTACADDGRVTLRIRDTGKGMSAEELANAMEPFRQVAAPVRARAGTMGGTGLGLPLTKALAEANRASFVVRSAADTGTLIEIGFPTEQRKAG